MAPFGELAPSSSSDPSLLPDLPKGPLCAYRKKASFEWKEMALFVEEEDLIRLKVRLRRNWEGSLARVCVYVYICFSGSIFRNRIFVTQLNYGALIVL